MKLVFMGTPVYALSCLEALIGAGHEIAAVFTQPDKPEEPRQADTDDPGEGACAEARKSRSISRLASERARTLKKSLEVLKEIAPECIVVVAYGQYTAGEHTGASEVRLHKRTRVAAADVPRSGSDTALYSVRREKIRSYHDVHGEGA